MENNHEEFVNNKNDWRAVMLAQYSMFGVMAGLEVTALTIFSKFDDNLTCTERWVFSFAILSLILQVVILLLLINSEREVASGNKCYLGYCNFQGKEKVYRWALIIITAIAWILMAILLIISIW